MNRLLLTFLALLAGLLAQGAPAQARDVAAGASQVGAMEAPLAQIGAAVQVQSANMSAATHEAPVENGGFSRVLALSVQVPTVHLGIDRARE